MDSVCHKMKKQIKQTFRVTLSLKHSGAFSLAKILFQVWQLCSNLFLQPPLCFTYELP